MGEQFSTAAVYRVGDNYSSNGDGTVDGLGGDDVMTFSVTDAGSGVSFDRSGYSALYIGNSGITGAETFPNYRTILDFDLSNLALPALGPGESYQLNSLELVLGISGGTNSATETPGSANRPETQISFFAGSNPSGALGAFLGTRLFNDEDNFPSTGMINFVNVALGTGAFVPGVDSSFALTLNADGVDEAGGNFLANGWFTLDSGLDSTGAETAGAVIKSPSLVFDVTVVPEPSVSLMSLLGLAFTVARRRRSYS